MHEDFTHILKNILPAFGFHDYHAKVQIISSGLIHKTWKVSTGNNEFILQQVNTNVFTQPENIVHNSKLIATYLNEHSPGYLFVSPFTINGEALIFLNDNCYRMFPFVAGSHSNDMVETPGQAYEAASQFGKFTRLLAGIEINHLKITIPHFHDLELRYRQFTDAVNNGNKIRITQSADLINTVFSFKNISETYSNIKRNPEFKLRVTHHDTKISNVLFDDSDKGICVIDLDTVMPGYFISDVGDMMRTYLCALNEDEADFSKIHIRPEMYQAIVHGYNEEMKNVLTITEKKYFFYAGTFMIYMQALRFLTDYLQDDIYYPVKYSDHNLARATNQTILLQELVSRQDELEQKL